MIFPKLSDGTIDWCVMCKHEGSNFYDLCCECEYPENSDDPPAKYEPKLVTNADRIRSMSDEELASWLCDVAGWLPTFEGRVHPVLEWLRQEAHDA